MADQATISAIADIILRVFDADPAVFEASLTSIKVNTAEVDKQNEIARIRKEIAAFVALKEDEIQALLGM